MARITKSAEERRAEIIAAARTFFKEKGQQNVTMQEIMERLGIAKGTIYYHFPSKEDLLEAIVEQLVDEELARKKAILTGAEGLDALEKFRLLLTSDTLAEDNEAILNDLHREANARMHAKQLGRYLEKLAPLFASVIEQGRLEGIFTTAVPLESAEFLLAGLQFLTDEGFYAWTPAQIGRRSRAFPALIEAQLGAPSGSFGFLIGAEGPPSCEPSASRSRIKHNA
jgi:AcrR family transcriptional regulator